MFFSKRNTSNESILDRIGNNQRTENKRISDDERKRAEAKRKLAIKAANDEIRQAKAEKEATKSAEKERKAELEAIKEAAYHKKMEDLRRKKDYEDTIRAAKVGRESANKDFETGRSSGDGKTTGEKIKSAAKSVGKYAYNFIMYGDQPGTKKKTNKSKPAKKKKPKTTKDKKPTTTKNKTEKLIPVKTITTIRYVPAKPQAKTATKKTTAKKRKPKKEKYDAWDNWY